MLKSNNGVVNTLATEGSNKCDITVKNEGETVSLDTKVVTATITGTMYDEEPLSLFKLDKVLQPRQLFKAAAKEEAPAPKGAKKKKRKSGDLDDGDDGDAPEPSTDDDDSSADDTASEKDGATVIVGGWFLRVFLALCLGSFVIIS